MKKKIATTSESGALRQLVLGWFQKHKADIVDCLSNQRTLCVSGLMDRDLSPLIKDLGISSVKVFFDDLRNGLNTSNWLEKLGISAKVFFDRLFVELSTSSNWLECPEPIALGYVPNRAHDKPAYGYSKLSEHQASVLCELIKSGAVGDNFYNEEPIFYSDGRILDSERMWHFDTGIADKLSLTFYEGNGRTEYLLLPRFNCPADLIPGDQRLRHQLNDFIDSLLSYCINATHPSQIDPYIRRTQSNTLYYGLVTDFIHRSPPSAPETKRAHYVLKPS